MKSSGSRNFIRVIIVFIVIAGLAGGVYYYDTLQTTPTPTVTPEPELSLTPMSTAETPKSTVISPEVTTVPEVITVETTPSVMETNVPVQQATATKMPIPSPTGGFIIYNILPEPNAVGKVQVTEIARTLDQNLYAGQVDGILSHGIIQFDLSFIPDDAVVGSVEFRLLGLEGEDLTEDVAFSVSILSDEIGQDWRTYPPEQIHNAVVVDTLFPTLKMDNLNQGEVNQFVFNKAQLSIVQQRLRTNFLTLRISSLTPNLAGWFAWDSGFESATPGQGPRLRLGVIRPTGSLAGAPTPTGTTVPTYVVVTSIPTPENILTAAAIAATLTTEATQTGTATPLPPNFVTPIAVTDTPVPENVATAIFQKLEETAAIIAFGTPTLTPINIAKATGTPTETTTPLFIFLVDELPPWTATPTVTPYPSVPASLIGKIAFKSDRTGEEQTYIINPDGTGIALLTSSWPYEVAEKADSYSIDGRFRTFNRDVIRYRAVETKLQDGTINVGFERNDAPAIMWYDAHYWVEGQVTYFAEGIAYQSVWSPTQEQITFVSNETGNDEIYRVDKNGLNLLQLTKDEYHWWDKHPSWSPDGEQIVFWSNRTGIQQLWVMDKDGGSLYSLSRAEFNDWDPVWIKYPNVPMYSETPDPQHDKPVPTGIPTSTHVPTSTPPER
ncbi:MAG: hypothetical protein B6242_01275 [Anaerolineaceae bacterium 4572_78]|nr:MAG: hypothetical protein B6242_01275 [Anaerolineaceae bacterium 4572_78]